MFKYLFLTIGVCLLVISPIFAQQNVTAKQTYQNVEVEKFTVKQGVEFPADKVDPLTMSIIKTLQKSNRFDQVSMTGESNAVSSTEGAKTDKLKISGEIIKYVKGSRATRYFIGLGMGATKIIANIKFVNTQTGETILEQTVDGDITWGLFGGDSDDAKSGVADEIMRVLKKNNLAGEKKKKAE